uniref:Protein kinase domain-containing protein n=1 Tax=Macrostomum lignano TaxID=282301 RepID=A0A1I8HGN6_9PLAT
TVLGSYSLNSSSGLWIGSRFVIASGRSQDGVLEVTLANLTVLNSGWYSCSGEVLDKKYERWPEAKGMHLDVVPHCFRQERGFQLHSIAYTAIGVGAALLVSLVVSTLLYLYYLQKRRSAPLVKRLRIVNVDNGELYQRNRTENSDSPLLGQSSYYRQESLDRPGWSLTVPEVVVEQVGPRGRRLFNRRGGSSRGSGASEANREVRYIIPACQVFELDRKRIHVVRKIGQGAFGTVLSGQYTFSGTSIHNVAIKMLKRPVLLLTELALYGNLRDFLKQRPVTSKQADYMNVLPDTREVCFTPCVRPVQLLHFSRDVARALQFMADIKIVHRDIAARNILVANSDEKGKIVAKVSDFGLTRNVSDKDYYRVITEGKLPVKWLAPECLKSQYFSSKSDV